MAEGVGVSDQQLDQWENYRLGVGFAGLGMREQRSLLGEVRASHAREAEQRAATILANKVWAEAAAERDVLQQRIDKALEECADSVFALKPPCSGLVSIESVRAALTGTDNQSTEETP